MKNGFENHTILEYKNKTFKIKLINHACRIQSVLTRKIKRFLHNKKYEFWASLSKKRH